ncbi:MAG: lysine biosynthesis protein LysW [Acidobacteriota bacterium]
MVDCPECAVGVSLGASPMTHEIVPCVECGVELEVMSLDPLAVELAPDVEEDWGE